MLCLCSGCESSASCFEIQAGKTFSCQGHALVTLYVQFLCSDWSKFDRWVHAEIYAAFWNLFTLTAEANRVLCQLVLFSELSFSTECTKWNSAAIKSLLGYSWLVCLLGFWSKNTSLVKVENPISEWHRFRFSPCLTPKRVEKSEAIPALLHSFQCISNGNHSWLVALRGKLSGVARRGDTRQIVRRC